MPTVTRGGERLHYRVGGATGSHETVAFLGEAGFGPWQWGWQHDALGDTYRTLLSDLRGHGDSTGSLDSVETLAADLEAVLGDAGVDRVHLLGFGLGGMVALRYADEYARARSLVLFGTAASGDAVDATAFHALFDTPGVPDPPDALDGLFSPAFREARPDLVERIGAWRREEDAPESVREAALDAMRAFDSGPLYELTTPALVLHGLEDPVVPVDAGEALAEGLPRARFEAVEGRRLCHAEHSVAVNDEVLAFLDEHSKGA